jgi:RNA polymerase sigma-70 factor (ECF subfamily)
MDLQIAVDPGSEIVRREAVSLAFVAALQLLAPRQRAALLLCDVLGFNHSEVAEVLGISTGAVNSLLSRARETVRAKSSSRPLARTDPRIEELLDRYMHAWHMADIGAFVRLISDDVRLSMPPMNEWLEGLAAVSAFVDSAIFAPSRPAGIPLRGGWCNGQPAFATYQQDGDHWRVTGLQILELTDVGGTVLIAGIVSYRDPALAVRCGMPETLR